MTRHHRFHFDRGRDEAPFASHAPSSTHPNRDRSICTTPVTPPGRRGDTSSRLGGHPHFYDPECIPGAGPLFWIVFWTAAAVWIIPLALLIAGVI